VKVALILDTSALLAHLRLERLSAGELIGEVADNGDVTGVPALAVLEALPKLDADERQRVEWMLADDDGAIVVLPLAAGDVLEVDRVASLIAADAGSAQAVVEANRHETSLATTRPGDVGMGVVIHPDDVEELS
jgi:hypothetical protein